MPRSVAVAATIAWPWTEAAMPWNMSSISACASALALSFASFSRRSFSLMAAVSAANASFCASAASVAMFCIPVTAAEIASFVSTCSAEMAAIA